MSLLAIFFPSLCKHPFSSLYIHKPETRERKDGPFDHITNHLHCSACGKQLEITAATFRDGLENYMNAERRKVGLPEVDYTKNPIR
jgi:hypothetical protein